VHIGYFPQDPRQELNPDQTLIDWMEGQLPQVSHEKIRQTLGACLFTGDDVKQLCRSLSGGECARLILAKLMLLNPNVLIFDEPTNHLDMEAIEALIEALNAFAGTVLLVSHNTYFLGRLAKSVVELNSQGAIAYPCDFEEYARQRQLSQESDVTMQLSRLEAQEEEKDSQDGREAYEARKRARNQRKQLEREIQEIETKTDALEAEIRRLDARLADPSFYEETSLSMQQEIAAEKEGVSQSLDSLLHAWEEKSEQLRSLELP
jgi:ABC-type multidrug transport system ATPase subunit